MGLIYHAALENSLIMCLMDSHPFAPLPVFCQLVDVNKMKSTIFNNRLVVTNRRIATAQLWTFKESWKKIIMVFTKNIKQQYYVKTVFNIDNNKNDY